MLSPLINDTKKKKKNQTKSKKNYLNTCSVGGEQKQFYVHVSVIYQINLVGKGFLCMFVLIILIIKTASFSPK